MPILTNVNPYFVVEHDISASFETDAVDARDYGTVSVQGTVTTNDPATFSVQMQVSEDGVYFEDYGTAVDVSTSDFQIYNTVLPQRYWRLAFTVESGGSGDTVTCVYSMKPYMTGGASAAGGGGGQSISVYRAIDDTADANAKTISVTGTTAIESVFVQLATNATTGNRQIVVEFLTSGNALIAQARAGVTQAASTTRYYMFAPSSASPAFFIDTDYTTANMPSVLLQTGDQVKVYDKANIADGADDMTISINGYVVA